MTDAKTVVECAYAAFNQRNMDGVLALMTEDVLWPKASEGGSVVGKKEIRAYWSRQWSEFDPRVEPIAIHEESDSTVSVRVHQVVKSLKGDTLSDSEVTHTFTMRDGLIAGMRLGDALNASAAFTQQP